MGSFTGYTKVFKRGMGFQFMKDKILEQLERELTLRKIDTEKAKRNAFMSMEFFFCQEATIENEQHQWKKKDRKK